MTQFDVIELDARTAHETAVIRPDGTVYIAIAPAWWDLATWVWWWFCPLHKKTWITITTNDNRRIKSRAVRVARSYLLIGKGRS